jgi:3-deoxy-D-manno-octulosonic-acid transferase
MIISFTYSYILYPLAVILGHFAAVFIPKLRKPILIRYKIFKHLKLWRRSSRNDRKTVLIHSASMGEFEHIKPLIQKLNDQFKVNIIVTFFSPSGYNNVKLFPGVSLFTYIPFDFQWLWRKFYKITNTKLVIISKHDVWINQIAVAKEMRIKCVVVNASLSDKSSRNKFFARLILSSSYQSVDTLFAISEHDKQQFLKSYKCSNVVVVGDTKFDQVLLRKDSSLNKEIIDRNWLNNKKVIVFGSIWPEDAANTLPAVVRLLKTRKDIKVIIVPHQLEENIIKSIISFLDGLKYINYSGNTYQMDSDILVIDKIGLLADIYKYADIAYVGGSFKYGIHNVMEPSVYGIPVIYGPFHDNSYDARKLKTEGGSRITNNVQESEKLFLEFLQKPKLREQIGERAYTFAMKNTGSSDKIIEKLKHLL